MRVVVTGMGALAPNGNTVPKYWNSLISGKSGIDYITYFDTTDFPVKIAGEIILFINKLISFCLGHISLRKTL